MLLATLVALAGCAATTLQSVWTDPSYQGGAFRKFFVVGLSTRDVTGRRVFEDVMAAKLQAAGVQAVPAWQYAPGDRQADELALQAMVAQAGADAVLMARLLGVDTRTSVTTTMVPGPGYPYGWWGVYSGWYAAPVVTQYEVATVETTLFDVRTKRLVWTATSQTINPTSIQQEAPGLADAVIGSLRAGGFLPPAK
jgi:hypothetical protein